MTVPAFLMVNVTLPAAADERSSLIAESRSVTAIGPAGACAAAAGVGAWVTAAATAAGVWLAAALAGAAAVAVAALAVAAAPLAGATGAGDGCAVWSWVGADVALGEAGSLTAGAEPAGAGVAAAVEAAVGAATAAERLGRDAADAEQAAISPIERAAAAMHRGGRVPRDLVIVLSGLQLRPYAGILASG